MWRYGNHRVIYAKPTEQSVGRRFGFSHRGTRDDHTAASFIGCIVDNVLYGSHTRELKGGVSESHEYRQHESKLDCGCRTSLRLCDGSISHSEFSSKVSHPRLRELGVVNRLLGQQRRHTFGKLLKYQD